jgi:hypothetical protein
MGRLETVSTTNVASSKKIRFWNATVSAAVASAAADPLDENTFQGQLKLLDLDNIRVAEVCGGASNVRRFPVHSRGGHFVLQLILAGELTCRSGGRETALTAGLRRNPCRKARQLVPVDRAPAAYPVLHRRAPA